ncbi:MAG: NAD(P)H-hydrate dehydratase [Candidatus Latescibacterota bacterium]|nr:NAD(P)H-hydrate dehydratase [Candidatus Latescibacterota bacterium]
MKLPKLVTGAEMAQIDRHSIDVCGVPGIELMERAGQRVLEVIRERWDGLEGLRICVLCGKGNNGGDGFVVARQLSRLSVPVRAFLTASADQVGGDAAHHLNRLSEVNVEVEPLPAPDVLADALADADVIVDAVIGTGLRSAPRNTAQKAIEAINGSRRPVVSVDIPSGVDATTGQLPGGLAVQAAVTVTLGLAKIGHLVYPGRRQCGILELVDIGFPEEAVAACPSQTFLITDQSVGETLPLRLPTAHKASCGAVAVVAGSAGMTGAAALTAESALRSGAGQAVVGVPASLNDIMEVKLTEAMTRPLPEVRRHRCLSMRAHGEILEIFRRADAVAIGPGLGQYRETVDLVRRIVGRDDLPPTVLDADGLNAVAGASDLLRNRCTPIVLTPHVGEFCRLSNLPKQRVVDDPIGCARQFAEKFRLTVVLKGAPTVVADREGQVFVNPTGNAGMATAGSGDVLAGVIAGLLAQGCSPVEAACCGSHLHGAAGDRARDEKGEWGMIAGDLLRHLPPAFSHVLAAKGSQS